MTCARILKTGPSFIDKVTKGVTKISNDNSIQFTLPNLKKQVCGNNITFIIDAGTDITKLAPAVEIPSKSSVAPLSGSEQNFTNPVKYTVTSSGGEKLVYTVTVISIDSISQSDKDKAALIEEQIRQLSKRVTGSDRKVIDLITAELNSLSEIPRMLLSDQSLADLDATRLWLKNLTKAGIRIACVGSSTTEGAGASSADYSWPAQMSNIIGGDYNVLNAGIGGTASSKRTSGSLSSYWDSSEFTDGKNFNPDIVIIMLGGNDAAQMSADQLNQHYEADYRALIAEYNNLPSKPYIILSEIPACFNEAGRQDKIHTINNPIIRKIGKELGLPVILLEDYIGAHPEWFADDKLHFNDTGYGEIAKVIAEEVRVISRRNTVGN